MTISWSITVSARRGGEAQEDAQRSVEVALAPDRQQQVADLYAEVVADAAGRRKWHESAVANVEPPPDRCGGDARLE